MTRRTALNPKLSGRHNRSIVCEQILRDPGISRSEIAERIGLTRAALSHILVNLIDEGLVVESKRVEDSGRAGPKSVSLTINPGFGRVVSVNIGHFTVTAAVFLSDGTRIAKATTAHRCAFPFDSSINPVVCDLIDAVAHQTTNRGGLLIGIGVGAPGYFVEVGPGRADERSDPGYRLYDWNALGTIPEIERRFGVPVTAGNCTDFAAIAESWRGAGRNVDRFVLYSVGLGVGSAFVDGGRLFAGRSGVSGEIGHTIAEIGGRECYCGNRGCLETYASLGNLLPALDHGYFRWVSDIDYEQTIDDIRVILEAAEKGEPGATIAVEKVARYVAIGAVTLVNLFAPDKLILTPNELGVTNIGVVVEHVKHLVRKMAFRSLNGRVDVVAAERPEDPELEGAFVRMMEHIFRENEKKA